MVEGFPDRLNMTGYAYQMSLIPQVSWLGVKKSPGCFSTTGMVQSRWMAGGWDARRNKNEYATSGGKTRLKEEPPHAYYLHIN
ncbi:MAG: hypothetical protein ACTSUE_23065 [Promethearchaeota archaeon]